jgi:NADH pyrophosphatase NudC (nudix superfamily)
MMLSESQLEALFPYMVAASVAAHVAAAGFLYLSRNAALKRQVFVTLVVASSLAILGLIAVTGAPGLFVALAGAVSAYAAWQGIRQVRFCTTCGANNFAERSGARSECKQCGAKLVG